MSNGNSSSRRLLRLLVVVIVIALHALPAFAQPKPKPAAPAPSGEVSAQSKDEARARFERGMTFFDKKVWDAALAEFLASRAAYPTRSNTQNAAICLRNLNRHDEALDMFEALLKDFPNLAPAERTAVEKEIKELESLVGTVDVRAPQDGAQISVDGRDRGTTPSPPVRVAAGSHVVKVYKEGFAPVEKRIEVASRQNVLFEAHFESLAQSGRLSVTESENKPAEVVVGNVVVGKTPWQGLVAVGDHVVFLRGEGNLGTQPASATVRINQVTPIVLALEALECPLRVEPTPSGATVAIDGVVVGSGVWDGRLRKGRHKVEVAQAGFVPQERTMDLSPAKPERIMVSLERDPNSPLWRAQRGPRIFVEIAPSFPLALVLGGEVADSGSSSFPLGVNGRAHAGYETVSGLGFGIDAGYLYLTRVINDREETMRPVGKPEARGTARDQTTLKGLLLGGSVHLRQGSEKMPLTLRVGVGALLANATDRRTAQMPDGPGGPTVDVAATKSSADLVFLYVAPEARLGYRITSNIELSAGVDVMLMVGLGDAKWALSQTAVLGRQGLASYAEERSLFGSTLLLVNPGVGARFEF
jgi:hypothetical protein